MKKLYSGLSSHQRTIMLERSLGIFAIITIIIAWIIGGVLKKSTFENYLSMALPEASSFIKLSTDIYKGLDDTGNEVIGYVASGKSTGYGGPVNVAVAIDLTGEIVGLVLVDDKETPSYLERVFKHSFFDKLLGKSYSDNFRIEDDIDGITSATYTSAAIANAVRNASRLVAREELGSFVPQEVNPKITFGTPEFLILGLYAMGYMGRRRVLRKTKSIRWVTMMVGMVFLGFVYNRPMTLSKISMYMMGYFPEWQTNLYWLFLIGGIIFVFSVDNRNPYCEWFCPFGAAQECMGAIGGAKNRFNLEQQRMISWIQRGVTWLAILIALIFRDPGVSSYEIFGTLFNFEGSVIAFVILAIVLLASMVSHRFWCNSLCPVHPVEGFVRLVRGWIINLWKKQKIKIIS